MLIVLLSSERVLVQMVNFNFHSGNRSLNHLMILRYPGHTQITLILTGQGQALILVFVVSSYFFMLNKTYEEISDKLCFHHYANDLKLFSIFKIFVIL